MITIRYSYYVMYGYSFIWMISLNWLNGSIYLKSADLINRIRSTIILCSLWCCIRKRNNKNKSKNKIYYPHIIWPKCVNLWVAGTGIEPVSLGYEPNVLPLYHPAIYLGFLWTKLKGPLETWTLLTGLQNRGIAIYAYRPFINVVLCI